MVPASAAETLPHIVGVSAKVKRVVALARGSELLGTNGHFLVFSLHWTIFSCVSSTVPFGRTLLNNKSAQSQSGRKMFHTGLKVFDKVATVRRSLHATELSPVRLETARTMREGG